MILKLGKTWLNFANLTDFNEETGVLGFVSDKTLTLQPDALATLIWFLSLFGRPNLGMFDINKLYAEKEKWDAAASPRPNDPVVVDVPYEVIPPENPSDEDMLGGFSREYEKKYGEKPAPELLEKARGILKKTQTGRLPLSERKQ